MDSIATYILASALIIIMLGMGLSLVLEDFKRIIVYPKAITIGLVNQIIFLPIIGYLIASTFSVKPEIAVGIMILAACPGGPTSNLISHLAKADVALSVTLTALSSIITIFTIPFIVNFALSHFADQNQMIQLDVAQTIGQIFVIVLIPVSIGMLVRHYKTDFALRMARPVRIASGIVLALVIVGIVVKEKAHFISYFEQAGIVAFLLNAISMTVGYYSARLFSTRKDRTVSISIESGIQNGTLAITIAVVMLNNTEYAIAPAVYSLIMFFTGAAVVYISNQRKLTVFND